MDNNLTLTIDLDADVFAGLTNEDNDAWTDSVNEIARTLRDLAEMIEEGGVPDEPIGLLDHNGNTIATLRENSAQAQSYYAKHAPRKLMASCVTHGSVTPCDCFDHPKPPTIGFNTMLDTLTDAYLQP